MSSGATGADAVADDLWRRVRELSARLARMRAEAAASDTEPGPDDMLRLERLRARTARALERAELADRLADRLAEVRRPREGHEGSAPHGS